MLPDFECYDSIVIGGGFFGLYTGEFLALRGEKVLVCEQYPQCMTRASYNNQARVHSGYHYPRSLLTAMRSCISFPMFIKEFGDCVKSDFDKYYGIGARFSDYISLVVDTGIGGGIMLDGRLYEGAHGFGSDFGHISLDMNGKRCSCGNRGCAELYGAMPNILAQARKLDAGLTSWRQVVDGAEAGQENALKILELEAGYLGALITNIANIFDIGTVILAGDIAYHGELITRRIEEIVNGQFIGRQVSRVSVYPSKMPEHANLLACANLVMEAFSRKQIPRE